MRVYLAPSWRGGAETLRPWVDGLRRRGFEAEALPLPLGPAARAVPRFLAVAGPDSVLGGTSFGGRVASLAAAQAAVAGLLCFAYPLGDDPEERTRHWPRVSCRTLVVNGELDELSDPEELRGRLPLLRGGRLELLPGAGHDLATHVDRVLDLAAGFLTTL